MSEAALIMKDKTPRVVSGDLLECGGKRSATTSRGFHYWLTSGPLARGSRSFAVAVDG